MALRVVTPPKGEPLTIGEAKTHLRELGDAEDSLIRALISAARAHCEGVTRRALVPQTLELVLDRFPAWAIRLPRPPLVQVERISYLDPDGEEREIPASEYVFDTASEPGRVRPAYGLTWPETRAEGGAVRVRYLSGYGAEGYDIPPEIPLAMRLLIGHWWENREAVITGTIASETPLAVEHLLWPHRLLGEVDL